MKRANPDMQQEIGALSRDKTELLKLLREQRSRLDQQVAPVPRAWNEGRCEMPASWAQQRLWFIDQIEGGSAAYHITYAVQMRGALNESALREALDALVKRHETLRTVFSTAAGELLQVIIENAPFALEVVDLSGIEADERQMRLRHELLEEARSAFDLSRGPLVRGRLVRIRYDEHVLLLAMHHIISDAWSMGVLLRELSVLYTAFAGGKADPLPPLPVQYADYACWQRDLVRGQTLNKDLAYWRAQLAGAAPCLELPLDRPRPSTQSYRGDNVQIQIDVDLTRDLRGLAERFDATLFMVLFAAWSILLSRLAGQRDVIIGTPVANRRRPELEGLIGFFVNALAVRVDVDPALSLGAFLKQVREVTLQAFDHQDAAFDQVVEALRPPRSLNLHPVFQVMFALQNAPQSEWRLPGLTIQMEDAASATSKLDLVLSLEEREAQLVGVVNYDTALFERSTIERWVASFRTLLRAMVQNTAVGLGRLSILPEDQRYDVIERFNATSASYPRHELLIRLFEAQVRRTPGAIAAICDDERLTYAQLDQRASALAGHLQQRGVRPREYVPVLMERSMLMLVAQLAVLKCGGVYVPLDPALPTARRDFMLADCDARVVLTNATLARTTVLPGQMTLLDCSRLISEGSSCAASLPEGDSLSPAYVMFTSGSTGTPKGVVVPQHAVTRLVFNNGYAEIRDSDCIVHHSNPSFDASTIEIWGALLTGARILIVPQTTLFDPVRFGQLLVREGASVMYLSVGLFNQYCDALGDVFSRMRHLMVGGDSLDPGPIRRVLLSARPQRLLNVYGPTECTTFSTHYVIESVDEDATSVPIGRPIANTRIYILDAYRQPVPIGVAGEMYIGGDGVALGYLNRPQLSEERFIPDRFARDVSARLYRTGDLARWRADGTIDFIGRNDGQVKVRGFRVEIGEVEAHLLRQAQVGQAVVVARADRAKEKQLVAYVVPREATALKSDHAMASELRAHLREALPEYMVPEAVMVLEALPLTQNGKVDRAALPAPDPSALAQKCHEPPQGDIEQSLADIWQDLLNVERVGRHDHFFEIGGHSLLAIRALFLTRERLAAQLSVTDMYRHPTVAELAERIHRGMAADERIDLEKEAFLEPGLTACRSPTRYPHRAVLLTGCTGFVGRFLLAQLLRDTDATIYCLVRAPSASSGMDRIKGTLMKWDLWSPQTEDRIVAVPGDLRQAQLGVTAAKFRRLAEEIDVIFHCATSMNHLETYEMARAVNVDTSRELVKLAAQDQPKLVNYISTLGIFGPSETDAVRYVDESTPIDHETHWASNGYVASKWVGEKIFMKAGARGIACNIFRLGLVWADSERGRYDELQREHRMLRTALLCRCGISNYRYGLSPTPVDYVARATVFLGTRYRDGNGIFHLSCEENSLHDVFAAANDILGGALRMASFHDWTQMVRQRHEAGESLPAVPLMQHAFELDAAAFAAHFRDPTWLRAGSVRTQAELERAGIVAPKVGPGLLRTCIEQIIARDPSLQGRLSVSRPPRTEFRFAASDETARETRGRLSP